MATFERLTNGAVIYTDDNGRKHGLDGKMNVLPHPDKPDLILISHEAYNHYQQKSITVNATTVTIPAHTDRNDLVLKLKTDFFFNNIELRTQTLENNELLVRVFQLISASASGTISLYPDTQIQLDLFADGIDALVLKRDTQNRPIEELAETSAGSDIAVVLFDAGGNYTLSGVPNAPAALRYFLKVKLKDLWRIPLLQRDVVTFSDGNGSTFNYIYNTRAPLATDYNYTVGDRWIDTVAKHEYLLLSNAVNAAVWKITTMDIDANGNVTFTGGVTFENGISYGDAANFTISANTNNLAITLNQVLIRLNSTGNYNLTGVVSPDPESTLTIYIVNIGANNVTLKNNDINSLAENRFNMGTDILLQPGEALIFVYDTIANKWQAFAKNI